MDVQKCFSADLVSLGIRDGIGVMLHIKLKGRHMQQHGGKYFAHRGRVKRSKLLHIKFKAKKYGPTCKQKL